MRFETKNCDIYTIFCTLFCVSLHNIFVHKFQANLISTANFTGWRSACHSAESHKFMNIIAWGSGPGKTNLITQDDSAKSDYRYQLLAYLQAWLVLGNA